MSTIVVVQKRGQACIAADSLTSFGDLKLASQYDRFHDKIQSFGDSHIGIVGSAAHVLVIEHLLQRDDFEANFTDRETIFHGLLEMHALLKEHYYLSPQGEEDDPYESSRMDGVIASPQGIFGIYALREVYQYRRFWAVGSGCEFALGAMHAVYDQLDSAEQIARIGIEAGAEFDIASALPMSSRTLQLETTEE